MSMESIYEYGARAGVWRLLDLFKSRGVPLTVFAVAMAAERHPAVIERCLADGHEIASHGYRWINYHGVPVETVPGKYDEQRQVDGWLGEPPQAGCRATTMPWSSSPWPAASPGFDVDTSIISRATTRPSPRSRPPLSSMAIPIRTTISPGPANCCPSAPLGSSQHHYFENADKGRASLDASASSHLSRRRRRPPSRLWLRTPSTGPASARARRDRSRLPSSTAPRRLPGRMRITAIPTR